MESGYENCLICGTPMSPFSQSEHATRGWVASLCTQCDMELSRTYGRSISDEILGKGSLVDKMLKAYSEGNEETQDKIINEIIEMVEDLLDSKSNIIDMIFNGDGEN